MTWLGLDIGGANLKAADGRGWARSVPFPLWREPDGLTAAVGELVRSAPATTHVAVTMTGELCDAYRTKTDGVRHIIASVKAAAAYHDVRIYLLDGQLVDAAEAEQKSELAAASNWHVLARFAGRFVRADVGIVIDMGSTTTDIVPLIDGQPRTRGLNDTDRLMAGELVYTGVRRTPICAVTPWLPWRDKRCPVAAEFFATTADAYVLMGDLPEQAQDMGTADGRTLTKEFCRERLARMICADSSMFDLKDAIAAAAAVQNFQLERLFAAYEQVVTTMGRAPSTIVLSGAGEFLGRRLVEDLAASTRIVSLSGELGGAGSECGPACALAVLADESMNEILPEAAAKTLTPPRS
jgi:(4-(4-[2-(gamma-L-glutamylamino)ethyl]phenoxymethyl)furan-2-yl)methanamine synthase